MMNIDSRGFYKIPMNHSLLSREAVENCPSSTDLEASGVAVQHLQIPQY